MNAIKHLDVAILAAKEAGKIHKKYFNKDFKIKRKSKSFELVTVADIESEKKIVSIIRDHFKDHNFLCEEKKYKKTKSEYTWIIDPLDGTNNFSFGLPVFSVSIALAKGDEVRAGVVYNVISNELFYAEKDKGAFLNNKKISVSKVDKLKEALFVTGFYYHRGNKMVENLETIKKFFQKNIIGLRRFGSAALDLCYVACGRITGFWEFELNPWDFAAGKLIVEEAGGKVTGRYGEKTGLDNSFIVAANNKIHNKMVKIINKSSNKDKPRYCHQDTKTQSKS
jgi:myo-inositol-1(or 4)-monophosphatase